MAKKCDQKEDQRIKKKEKFSPHDFDKKVPLILQKEVFLFHKKGGVRQISVPISCLAAYSRERIA